jgi:intracellular multiplication protein IcmK
MLRRKTTQIVSGAICIVSLSIMSTLHAEGPSQALEQLQLLQHKIDKKGTDKDKNVSPNSKSRGANDATRHNDNKNSPASKNATASTDKENTSQKRIIDSEPINTQAFSMLQKKLFPLKTKQVLELHKKYNQSEYALAATPGTPPRPTATSQMVNLSPGSTPPVIRLAQGFVSSVVFLDSSGAPWPIVSYDLGDPAAFSIQWDKSGNTLMIQSKKLYTYGNLAIRLEKLNTPVMLTLVPGQKAVDYRVDMRVQGYGPNARNLPTGTGLPNHASNLLLKVLEGVPPNGSSRLMVKGGPAGAWVLGDRMFVRTRLTILSPGWVSTMTSADGTHAYEMAKAPVLLVSWHGKVMQLKLEGL